jgi:hypothetical protein
MRTGHATGAVSLELLTQLGRGAKNHDAVQQGLKSGKILNEPGRPPANIRDAITSAHR